MFVFRLLFCGLIYFTLFSLPAFSAIITVSNTNDFGPGSFRQALLDGNSLVGKDIIQFQIPGAPPYLIAPKSLLPAIVDPVTIDGTSQPGFAGQPLVRLDGLNAGTGVHGLVLLAGQSEVRGLMVTRFSGDGIRIEGAGTNLITGNYLGIGFEGAGDFGNGEGGITIYRSSGNRIGGSTPASRNIISGGNLSGIYIIDAAATGNEILGNFIGTDPSGTTRRGNRENGIVVYHAAGNLIGGPSASARNVISGNSMSGIFLLGQATRNNWIAGNYIGTSAAGNNGLSNSFDGISVSGACSNVIGGTQSGAGNVISGNHKRGIFMMANSRENVVQGNLIGTDFTGTVSLGNNANGMAILDGSSNRIGGASAASRNIISGNRQSGVLLTGTNTAANIVQGNFIGVDLAGSSKLSNSFDGINLSGAISNQIGGSASGEGNLISGNGLAGIFIATASAKGNQIQGNLIGTDFAGATMLGNRTSGVWVESPGNLIGGSQHGARNVISGNQQSGVFLSGITATNNRVLGNLIGTDLTGKHALGNAHSGVALTNAQNNFIGGTNLAEGNVISGNSASGIIVQGTGSALNRFQGNYIGTDASGTDPVPNVVGGIYFYSAGNNWVGGTNPGAGNVISGNFKVGIAIGDFGANSNVVQGNLIGTAADGFSPLGNQWHGIEILNTSSNNMIGGAELNAANRIAYTKTAGYAGVRVRDGCSRNLIRGNVIFANAGLGIDLGNNGVNTLSTSGNWQQFPVINSATGQYITLVQGTMEGGLNKNYTLDFYASSENDLSGNGEGFQWLGTTSVTPGVSGVALFSVRFTNSVPIGRFISATAIDATNNTSEYSASKLVPIDPVVDSDGDGMADDFEKAASLNPLSPIDAPLDSDQDGLSNFAEYIAGTDPKDFFSTLKLTMDFSPGAPANLRFDSVSERNYAIQVSHDFSLAWTTTTNFSGTGFPVQIKQEIPTTVENRYYRVRVSP